MNKHCGLSQKYYSNNENMKNYLSGLEQKWSIRIGTIDNVGAIIKEY